MTTMSLDARTWTLGPQLPDGDGGFGRVFNVTGENGLVGVAKFVAKDPGAERELLMGDSVRAAAARNVVPVWDTGEHAGQWVIVMPKADKSLLSHMTAGPVPIPEAVDIMRDIATALADLAGADPAIIHRDLKPGNILFLDGSWCLADFGIARYAEQTTGADTRNWALTRPYAAPEQWRMERATPATDVYAFGVIAYELLAGSRPFPGPDFRHQHLFETAPTLTAGTPRLRTLIEECLYKPMEARPSAANILARLKDAGSKPSSPGASRLAQANIAETERLARDYAEAVRQSEAEANDAALFEVARQSFESISQPLVAAIEADAPIAHIEYDAGSGTMAWVAQLRGGKLGLSKPRQADYWEGPFRLIAEAVITVNQSQRQGGYEGRSHSLWFCDAQEEGRFAWYETAFMSGGLGNRAVPSVDPFSREGHVASVAFSRAIGTLQLAWPFEEVDRADPSGFVDRWIGWFADAATGTLSHPSSMPEKPTQGSYRLS
ncbi:serine/threonine-protein kinase [Nocardioides antri]|uniref:non-specific serine/threonine protein kinase n=1 Tax=Nocardioides antri TaxID=2607659 RepID=A0A5B1LUA1_9ACTN|nr:serine/threonine-protein kinase [Nocardioides antri]KAA1423197.1 serine/threonine protein kinase [Nocardioides antri]